jgi:adenylate kinase
MGTSATILIMGPPGAGKGTQAAHLVSHHGLHHLATGDVLRTAVNEGTAVGKLAKTYMDAGKLVPDDVIIGTLREFVEAQPRGIGLLLDGFPRTVAQAEALDGMLAEMGRCVDLALDVHVPSDVLVKRLSSRWICRTCQRPYNTLSNPPKKSGVCDLDGGELYQRDDDRAESVAHRLEVYANETAPVSDYYSHAGVRVQIDGDQPMAAVQAQLDAAIAERVGVGS